MDWLRMDWEEEDRKPNIRSASAASSRSPSPDPLAASASHPDHRGTYDADTLPYQEDGGYSSAQYAGDDYEGASSDEEPLEQLAAARRRREGEAVPGLFAEEQVLPEETFGSKTVRELYEMVEEGTINLNPPYQRDVVWKEDICQGLIGSIFRNMHIPEILFNVYTPDADDLVPVSEQHDPGEASPTQAARDKGKERETMVPRLIWNCADGKQRLTAVRKFMNDQYHIKVDGGKLVKYSTLPAAARAIFDQKRLRFGFYRELNDQQEREIFTRVQLGKRLSKAEEANAITSEYKTWIDELVKEYAPEQQEDRLKNPRVFAPRITNFTRNKALVIIFAAAHNFLRGYRKAEHCTEIQRRNIMTNDDRPSAAARARVKDMFDRLRRLSLVKALPGDKVGWPKTMKPDDPRQNMAVPHRVWWRHKAKAGLSPVEFQFIPLLLQKYEALSDGDMLEIIERFRDTVAEKHAGNISDNVTVFKTMQGFLNSFYLDDLKHRYNDDGSRRTSKRASNGLGSASTASSAATRANGVSSSSSSLKKKETPSSSRKKDTSSASGAPRTNGVSSSNSAKDKSTSSSYGTNEKSKSRIDAPAPLFRPSSASTRPESRNDAATLPYSSQRQAPRQPLQTFYTPFSFHSMSDTAQFSRPSSASTRTESVKDAATLPYSSQRQAPSQPLQTSYTPFSLPSTSNPAQPSSSYSQSFANAQPASTNSASFFGLPPASPPRVKREPRSASPPRPIVKREPRDEDFAIPISRPAPPPQPPVQGISAKRKVVERLTGARIEPSIVRPSSAQGSTSQTTSTAIRLGPSTKRAHDSSRGDMSGFDERGRPITRRPAADEDDMLERFGGRGDDDIVVPGAEEYERASKRPRADDRDEAVSRAIASRAGGGAMGGGAGRWDAHSSVEWEREREQRERERDRQMMERLGRMTGGSASGSGGTYSRDGRSYSRDRSRERTDWSRERTNAPSRVEWRASSTRRDEEEKRRSTGGDSYRDPRPSDGGWGPRSSHLGQQQRPRQSSTTSDSNGVSSSSYNAQRGSTVPVITYPDIPSVSYPAKMTNLITSLLQIVQGFINAIVSLLETVLSLFKTFVEDIVILAKSTVEFFLKNIVVLGVVAAVFVGFSVLEQRNRGGVRNKAQGLKKQA
ncbi:hypothetical protein JCM1840_006217 [Sporobolomyces johnsonii]